MINRAVQSSLLQSLWRNRLLILQMSKREIVGRYKGSFIGLGWSFINPILMLAVYTFVFSFVFKARWGGRSDESIGAFAELLFAGLIVHTLFSEVVLRAPGLILSNVNYVKKVVFPLEVLPIISMVTALFHGLISVGVLLAASVFLNGYIPWTVLFLPVVLSVKLRHRRGRNESPDRLGNLPRQLYFLDRVEPLGNTSVVRAAHNQQRVAQSDVPQRRGNDAFFVAGCCDDGHGARRTTVVYSLGCSVSQPNGTLAEFSFTTDVRCDGDYHLPDR